MDPPSRHLAGSIEIFLADGFTGLQARHQHVHVRKGGGKCFVEERGVGRCPVIDDFVAEPVDDLLSHLLPVTPEPAGDRMERFDVGRRCHSPSGRGLTRHQSPCRRL
jgi:hypothetical protein